MQIAAQCFVILLLALVAILCWRGFRYERSMAFKAVLIILAGLVALFSVAPEVHELQLAIDGIAPQWEFRFEAFLALGLVIWHAREWAYG